MQDTSHTSDSRKIATHVFDKIAMNPRVFKKSSVEDVLATLVHEMVHLEQFHFGNPSRGKYHNREWGRMMKRFGLYPSNTGKPGGKETGQQMTHYVVEGGPFSITYAELLKTGLAIEYADVWSEKERKEPDNSKLKYTCSACGANAWGKPKSNLVCGDCLGNVLQQIGASTEVVETIIKLAGMTTSQVVAQ